MKENTAKKGGFLDTFMNVVEAACNKLPPPTILFCYLFVIVAVIGTICTVTGVALVNPATDEVVMAKNLFTVEGLHWFLDNMVKNFTGYGPLGLVLVMTLGIGLCDEAGLLMTLIKSAMKNVPPALVPYVIVFIGIVMNIASDSASVAVPPLAAVVYMGVNKHPVVGLLCGYIGAQVGYAANILPSGTDTLLMGFTNDTLANFLPDAGMTVDATCNWFFKAASTFLCCAVIGTVVMVGGKVLLLRVAPGFFPEGAPFWDWSAGTVADIFYPATAVLQEFLARGVMQENLNRVFSGKHAMGMSVFVSSLAFGVMHIHYGLPYMLAASILLGALGMLYNRQRNIWGLCIIHYVLGEVATFLRYVI